MAKKSSQKDTLQRAYWRKEDYRAIAKYLFENDLVLDNINIHRAAEHVFEKEMNVGSINAARRERIAIYLREMPARTRVLVATNTPAKRPLNPGELPQSFLPLLREEFRTVVNDSNLALSHELSARITTVLSRFEAHVQGMLDRQYGMMRRMMDELGISTKQLPTSEPMFSLEEMSRPEEDHRALSRIKILVYGVNTHQRDAVEAWAASSEGKALLDGVDMKFSLLGEHVRSISSRYNYISYFTNTVGVGKNGVGILKEHCDETWPITGPASSLLERIRQLLQKVQVELKQTSRI